MATTSSHPTTGRAAGFRTQDREVRVDRLDREGELPGWLHGALLRTGPAVWDVGDRTMRHWFDGLAMLHRFAIADGEVAYASRMLETRAWRAARERGAIAYSEFATDPCRSLFARVASVFSPRFTDNANVNLARLGERWIAMTETPIPVQFDSETLAAAGVAYEVPGQLTTAHPHRERGSGAILNFTAHLGPRSEYRFFRLAPDAAASPTAMARSTVREPGYTHSFGLTPRWLVLAELPFVVAPARLALSGRPYIENYRWRPERGLRFHLYDRATGAHHGPFATEPRFVFHHVNAYEEGDEVVVDMCTFPDAGIVEDLYLQRLRDGGPVAPPALERYLIAPTTGAVTVRRLADEPLELPRINYARVNEQPYRYAWGAGIGDGWFDRVVKVDVETGETKIWHEAGCFPGEPVFVGRPGAEAEGDGALLSVVLGPDGGSFLLVLDAATLHEHARAATPQHIPFGFHGAFSGRE